MLIERFIKKGKEFLGCKYPIMCGAMTWVSDPKLVGAVGNAGGFGLLAGGNAPVEVLKKEIIATREMSDHSFGVNLITLAPGYESQLDLVCKIQPLKQIIDEMIEDAESELQRLKSILADK